MAESLPGGGPPTAPSDPSPSRGSVSVGPGATFDTGLTHDVTPLQFAGLLTALGLLWFSVPGEYHWPLAFALILGALVYANKVADAESRVKPLDLFSSVLTGKGL